jgi:hypothetical protein
MFSKVYCYLLLYIVNWYLTYILRVGDNDHTNDLRDGVAGVVGASFRFYLTSWLVYVSC